MTTATLTLTSFLLARIAEDEVGAGGKHDRFDCDLGALEFYGDCSCGYPARVLVECEAKRRIVADYSEAMQIRDGAGSVEQFATFSGIVMALYQAVSALASAYSDHADYRDDWRP